jgi:group II intron reverse transcriptase/maturase
MQSADTVLEVLRERGRRGLPCDELYRQLFNPQLYLMAYGRLYSNHGAMTPGAYGETADGMSEGVVDRIIDAMRHERYRFLPVRRIHIPKKNGKTRPLGLPSWSDKLVGEVVRLLLEAYYEPRFSDRSHGFRPGRGCHTALKEVGTWTGTTWFVEGDISDCFGSLDHDVLMRILGERIRDNRFLRLVRNMLRAGYLEDWRWNETLSGAPQGGVTSPLLSNIYLHRLDVFVERGLIPEYTRGVGRIKNPAYRAVENEIWRIRQRHRYHGGTGEPAEVRELRKRLRTLPSGDPDDPGYRRLRYVRYADDILLGFIGPKNEAEEIKQRLAWFLRDELCLELSQGKTLVTHAKTSRARFLGYEITVQHIDSKITRGTRAVMRATTGKIRFLVPSDVVMAKCSPFLTRGKPEHQPHLTSLSDFEIVSLFGAQYRGLVNYYLPAANVAALYRVQWVMLTSMLKTLAAKHRSTVTTMAMKHMTTIATPHGPRRCYEAVLDRSGKRPLTARFGGIPLRRQKWKVLDDHPPGPLAHRKTGSELIRRLKRQRCELCDTRTTVDVHQVRSLADLARTGGPQPAWAQVMAKRNRKTLVVCPPCHDEIHAGQPVNTAQKSLESRMR